MFNPKALSRTEHNIRKNMVADMIDIMNACVHHPYHTDDLYATILMSLQNKYLPKAKNEDRWMLILAEFCERTAFTLGSPCRKIEEWMSLDLCSLSRTATLQERQAFITKLDYNKYR